MDLDGKRELVVGAARSGQAAARFLAERGVSVTLTDVRRREELRLPALPGVTLLLGGHPRITRDSWDLVVVSPGVPSDAPLLVGGRRESVPVIGELELAWLFARAPIVAVTGTNGKTTTTALLGEVFRQAGFRTLVAGNIGVPLISQVEHYGPDDVIVAEVSSFQLETVREFRPRVAVVLNLTPDHLDRHGDMDRYMEAKAAVFAKQRPSDHTVLNYDDPRTAGMARRTPGRVIFFSRRHRLDQGVFVHEGRILMRDGGRETAVCGVDEIGLPGAHNLENALAAVAAGWAFGVGAAPLARALAGFPGVPHRLELVGIIGGVRFVNDSKATNPEAACRALEAYAEPIVLIAGGRNKGNDLDAFMEKVRDRVVALVVLGECAEEMARAAGRAGVRKVLRAADLTEAVSLARSAAVPGGVVLLSPACASWDMFNNYEERGDLFRRVVQEMAREAG